MTDFGYDPDRDPVLDLAEEITGWQQAAHSLPLATVSDIARDATAHLGCLLNDFNQARRDQPDGQEASDALDRAVGEVICQATAAAIYTLAAAQRRRHAAAYS